jgi:GNAT superfamily N-acetyltransferase
MADRINSHPVEPLLLWDWLSARSVARALPLPVPDRGGMRVDTNSAAEIRRYVFAGPVPAIRELTALIHTPRTFIKMCGPGQQLLAMAPPGWQLQPLGYLMTLAAASRPAASIPQSYRLEVSKHGQTITAAIFAKDGSLAASGYAVEYGHTFVFDRINTHPDHRRFGLGRALMAALGGMQASTDKTKVLVATEEGRALYEALGWTTVSAYSTIVIPG